MYLQEFTSPGVGQIIVARCSESGNEISDAVKKNKIFNI